MENPSNDDIESAKIALRLNLELQMALGEPHEKSSLVNEKLIIASDSFLNAILEARKKLKFTNTHTVDEGLIIEWAVSQLSDGKVNKSTDAGYYDLMRLFFEEVSIATKNANLPKSWETYVAFYIVNQRSPEPFAFGMPENIKVIQANTNGDLLIKLSPNLRHEDYKAAWNVFNKHLGLGKPLNRTRPQAERDYEIFKNKGNLTQRQLAKKYLPNQAKNDIVGAIKSIQQIVKRQRRHSREG